MNEYIRSIDLLNQWWGALNEEWRYYLYLEYLYRNDKRSFYSICEAVINHQEYFDECMDEKFFPNVIHYAFKAKELTRFDMEYTNEAKTGGLTFNLETVEPVKDMLYLRSLNVTGCRYFKPIYLKELVNLEHLTIYASHAHNIVDILLLNLPKLKKISIESDGYDGYGSINYGFETIKSVAVKTRVEIEEYALGGDICFVIDRKIKDDDVIEDDQE